MRPRRKANKKARQAAAAVEEEIEVELDVEGEETHRILHSSGEYWVRYTCPKGDCRASFEILTQGVLAIFCAACGAKMRWEVRRAD